MIEELVKEGYDLTVAFWARPIEEEKWFLYISSTVVNDKGIAMAYKIVYDAVSRMPELGFDIFDIKVLAAHDVMAQAALGIIRAEVLTGHSAGKSAEPYVGITRFRGNSLVLLCLLCP